MFLEPRRKKNLPYFLNPLSFFEVTLSTSLSISALKVVSWSVAKGSTRGITLATSFKTNVQNIKKKKMYLKTIQIILSPVMKRLCTTMLLYLFLGLIIGKV